VPVCGCKGILQELVAGLAEIAWIQLFQMLVEHVLDEVGNLTRDFLQMNSFSFSFHLAGGRLGLEFGQRVIRLLRSEGIGNRDLPKQVNLHDIRLNKIKIK